MNSARKVAAANTLLENLRPIASSFSASLSLRSRCRLGTSKDSQEDTKPLQVESQTDSEPVHVGVALENADSHIEIVMALIALSLEIAGGLEIPDLHPSFT
jgi:hypothetical protein